MLILLLFGILITYAEPAIGALLGLVSLVDPKLSPYLYYLLHTWVELLVFFIGLGMGVAAVLGTLRFVYGWKLRNLLAAITVPAMCFTAFFTWGNPDLYPIVGISWDVGCM